MSSDSEQDVHDDGSQSPRKLSTSSTPRLSLAAFLFGNIDENGQLEDDVLDEESKRHLSSLDRFGIIPLDEINDENDDYDDEGGKDTRGPDSGVGQSQSTANSSSQLSEDDEEKRLKKDDSQESMELCFDSQKSRLDDDDDEKRDGKKFRFDFYETRF